MMMMMMMMAVMMMMMMGVLMAFSSVHGLQHVRCCLSHQHETTTTVVGAKALLLWDVCMWDTGP
jgi:hypothetical protein